MVGPPDRDQQASGGAPAGTRRLAAVLAADSVGYSAAMERDPEGTIQTLSRHRATLGKIVAAHGGSVVAEPGDFMLVLFDSAEAAVDAAAAWITASAPATADAEPGMQFRIGIDLGEVFEEDGGYFGTAINVAARLQQLAEPSGVIASKSVVDLLPTATPHRFLPRGTLHLKNISRPIEAHSLHLGAATDHGRVAPPARQRPEIVIRGFESLGGHDRADLFAGGLTEELVTTLGSLSAAFVCRRELPAGGNLAHCFELSGRVRNGDRLRITAKLVASRDGTTIWSERYDFDADASYDAQERIAQSVVTALQIKLSDGEQARLWSSRTTSLAAWEKFHRARLEEARYRRSGHAAARQLYRQAIELDGTFTPAMVALGFCHLDQIRLGWSDDPAADLAEARHWHAVAAGQDAGYSMAGALEAFIAFVAGDHAAAAAAMRAAVEGDPENADVVAYYATLMYCLDDLEAAVRYGERAIAMMPTRPSWMAANLGFALLGCDRVDEARAQFETVLGEDASFLRAHIGLVIVAVLVGDLALARRHAATLVTADPAFRIERWAQSSLFPNRALRGRYVDALGQAGLG